MSIEAGNEQRKNKLVEFVESSKNVKRASTLIGLGGLLEIVLKGNELSSDNLTRVVAITGLAFINSAIFNVLERAEKTK